MIPHLQIERELAEGELIDLTPGLLQRRMLYWHRFSPESRLMRKVTDALLYTVTACYARIWLNALTRGDRLRYGRP